MQKPVPFTMKNNSVLFDASTNPFIVQTNAVLGAVEVATFIALILFGISLSQGYAYFRTWSESDGMGTKFLVSIFLVILSL